MFKQQLVALALVSTFALALANPLPDGADVKEGLKEAFKRGIDKFGDHVQAPKPAPAPVASDKPDEKPHIYSLYTKDLKAPGGGKPATNEQYRKNHYDPLVPTLNPVEHKVVNPDKMTPKEAAEVFKPQQPYQYSTDRVY